MAKDPYAELGVSHGASADDIRKAFRKLAKAHHPDANPGNKASEERFKRISAAFDLLGDPEKKRKFDAGEIDADGRETMRGFQGSPFGQGGPGGSPFGRGGGGFQGGGFEGVDLDDLFGGMFGGGRGAARGGAGGAGGGFGRNADMRAKLEIDLEEAIKGGRKRVTFADGRTLDITIPKGAAEGQVLRLRGQGGPGRAGPGDALIELSIAPHAVFRREGETLVMDLPVSVPDAVLGGKVQAETPDGPVTLSIPKGSNSGATLRLKGRGLPGAGGVRGDLLAKILVTLPEAPDATLEAFAQDWRDNRPYVARRRR